MRPSRLPLLPRSANAAGRPRLSCVVAANRWISPAAVPGFFHLDVPHLRVARREEEDGRDGFEPARSRRAPSGSDRSRSPEVSSCRMSPSRRRPRRYARSPPLPPDLPAGIAAAAHLLLPHLERGSRIDAVILRAAMEHAFGGSDAVGAWDWKTAYDACEAATVLFLRKFGPAIRARAGVAACRAVHARQNHGASSHPYPPIRGEPGASAILDAARARRLSSLPPLRSARPISCSNPQPARACSPSSPSSRAADWP